MLILFFYPKDIQENPMLSHSEKDKNQKILALNSLQSVSNEQIQGGMTYLGLMQENYDTLKEALS